MMKNNKGITLIALVITIIVLLILAGVSIAMLTGNNGILTQATNADKTTTIAGVREKVELAIAAAYSKALSASPSGATISVSDVKEQYNTDNGENLASVSGTDLVIKEKSTDTNTYTVKLTQTSGGSFTVASVAPTTGS